MGAQQSASRGAGGRGGKIVTVTAASQEPRVDEDLAALEALKGEGNDLFAHGDFAGAAAKYGEVVDELAPGMAKNGRLCAEVGVHRLYVVALSNRAQCRINAGDAGGGDDGARGVLVSRRFAGRSRAITEDRRVR